MKNKYAFGKIVNMSFGEAVERVTQALIWCSHGN